MKRLKSKLACAALGLSLCFGSMASASIPVSMAPSSSQPNFLTPVSGRVIIVIIVVRVVGDLPQAASLEHVDQSQFDQTN
jgi:hypothetical protein